jgi:hypothetical protein
VLLAVSIRVLVLPVLAGLNDPVTPLGRLLTERFTVPLKLFCEFTVTVEAAVAPWLM